MTIQTTVINFCPPIATEVAIKISDNLISLKDQELENILLAKNVSFKIALPKVLTKTTITQLSHS